MLNVTVIMDLKWPSTSLGTNIGTTFTQHFLNIVSTSSPKAGSNIATSFTRCYLNVVSTSIGWAPTLRQHSHNIAWMLSQHQSPTLRVTLPQHSPLLPECCLIVIPQWWKAMLAQYPHNVKSTLSQCWSSANVAGIFNSIYKCTSPQQWDRRWDNVGTNVVTTLPKCWRVTWVLRLIDRNVFAAFFI